MRLSISAAVLLLSIVAAQAADDNGVCLAAPTRACVLGLAVKAIEPVVAERKPADTDRMMLIWETTEEVIGSAADAGQFDLAMELMSRFDQSYSGIEHGQLFAAMKLASREKELSATEAEERLYGQYTGPALVAGGRDADFADLVKSQRLSGYDLTAMQMAGDLMAGKADLAIAALAPFTGDDRINAVTETLRMLRLARRLDASAPLLAYEDLTKPDGIVACSGIAQGTKDRAIAEQCLGALNALSAPVKAEYFGTGGENYFGYGTVVPEVVGALAAVGDWEQALSVIRAQPRQYQEPAIIKLAKYAHSPELLPIAQRIFVSRSAKSGAALVRMLVLAGQPAEAASYISTAADDKIRDRWTNALAEALAEIGDPAAALPSANAITDPVLRARALVAVADALFEGTGRRSAPNSMWRRAGP